MLTTRLQCGLIATVKSVFSEIPRTSGPCVSGSRAYADVPVGGERGRAPPDPARYQDVLPERTPFARIADSEAEAFVQAVHGAADRGLRREMYGLKLHALGSEI